ncbi:MAG: hypothetical protein QMC67_17550 [Candidatus Wallbacteria bacterium]
MKKIIYFLVFACAFVLAISGEAFAQIAPDDPMVKITSLPLGLNVNEIMPKISDDVAKATGITKTNITYYWQTFDAVYCPSSKDPAKANIIFVDLYVPCFFTEKEIASMLTSLADSIEKHTKISKEFLFIQTHFPKEGHVYISGKVAKWNTSTSGAANKPDLKK